MNTLDRNTKAQATEAKATKAQDDQAPVFPVVSYINEQPLTPATSPRTPWLTIDQLYVWGFRLFCGLCLGFLLFVAAIYYQLINP